jgi:hypothetical protein
MANCCSEPGAKPVGEEVRLINGYLFGNLVLFRALKWVSRDVAIV